MVKALNSKGGRFIPNVAKMLSCDGGEALEEAPGEVVNASFLVTFKAELDRALSNLI